MKVTMAMTDKLGMRSCHPYVMKKNSPDKYEYIASLGDDFLTAYKAYQDEMRQVSAEATEMYYWLADRWLISKFSREIQKAGLHKHEHGFANSFPRVLFREDNMFGTHGSFLIYKEAVKIFKKFKERENAIGY